MATETTTLEVVLAGKDMFSAVAAKVAGGIKNMEHAAGRTGSAFSSLSGRIGHAQKAVGGLLTGPLGIIGLSAGLFSLGGALEGSLRHTSDFALGLEKLMGLTGESAQSMGSLILLFEKYGLSVDRTSQIVGFAEKTLGKLNEAQAKTGKSTALLALEQEKLNIQRAGGKTKTIDLLISEQKAADALHATHSALTKLDVLDQQYGLHLKDAKGHVVDFTTELNQVSAYYNSNASASNKAILAATLFGRGYAAILPILKLGTKGIAEASQQAKDLGLTLDQTNVAQISAYRESIRSLGEAMGILQLNIGTALIPVVTELANSITHWLSTGGAKQITQWFRDGAKFAQDMGKAVQDDVLPIFGAIAAAWAKVPSGLQSLLIGGFVANKASKFLFDFGIKDAVGGAKGFLESLLGKTKASGVVGALDPGQRVFVTNWPAGFGGSPNVPGIPAVAGSAATAGGAGVAVSAGVLALGISTFLIPIILDAQHKPGDPYSPLQGKFKPYVPSTPMSGFSGASAAGNAVDPNHLSNWAAQVTGDFARIDAAGKQFQQGLLNVTAAAMHARNSLAMLGDKNWAEKLAKGIHDRSVAKFGGTGLGKSAESATYQRDILGRAASIMRHGKDSADRLERLKALMRDAKLATDATKTKLSADIRVLAASIKKQPILVNVQATTNVLLNQRKIGQVTSSTNAYGQITPGHGNTNAL